MKLKIFSVFVLLVLCLFLVHIGFAQASLNPNPEQYISGISPHLNGIYNRGIAHGNRADVFAKVGDSITMEYWNLSPLGEPNAEMPLELGPYEYLHPIINKFSVASARTGNSFNNISAAAKGGWTSADLLDPKQTYFRLGICPDEAPINCEYRLLKPSYAFVMIGTNDLGFQLPINETEANLRQIIEYTMSLDIIPVMSTIPPRRGYDAEVLKINEVVARLAVEYKIPLIDFYAVLLTMPNYGLRADGIHPSFHRNSDLWATFWPVAVNKYGFNMRNLLQVQALYDLDQTLNHKKSK